MVDPYVYPGIGVLKNKLGIKNHDRLRKAEGDICFGKLLTVDRDVDCSKFDLDYIKNIHKYILEDIFDWAGEFRTVPMVKPEKILGGDTVRYAHPNDIVPLANECLNELNRINWNSLGIEEKSMQFTKLIARLWQIHPFRDGNTRTTVTYAFQFAEEHGFKMDRNLLLDNFEYVRGAFVKASDGEYSEYHYLNNIIKDSIQRGAKLDEGEVEKKDKSKTPNEVENCNSDILNKNEEER